MSYLQPAKEEIPILGLKQRLRKWTCEFYSSGCSDGTPRLFSLFCEQLDLCPHVHLFAGASGVAELPT